MPFAHLSNDVRVKFALSKNERPPFPGGRVSWLQPYHDFLIEICEKSWQSPESRPNMQQTLQHLIDGNSMLHSGTSWVSKPFAPD